MRKSIKKFAASLMAATMVLGSMSMAFADDETPANNFTADDVADGAVHYTIPGGINDWNPLSKDNELTATVWDGVYSKVVSFPAFDADAEWNSRFKVCKIDDISIDNGWLYQLCLGTTTFDDNQTAIRVETEEAVTDATVYFDVNTGAVAIMKDGKAVDYKFSWVGADNEVQYTTISEFATADITWPSDKVKADAPTDLEANYNALVAKVNGTDLSDESLYEDGSYKYTLAGGSSPVAWATTSSANELKESGTAGVYTIDITFPAFSEDKEYLNRFKICRLDDITCANGWLGSLCLGTDVYDDNQTTFRVENEEEVEATVYFYPATGAVVIRDKDGKNVDYKFSWVGYDDEVQYTTVAEFASAGITWPDDKVKADEPKDLADKIATLNDIIDGKAAPAPAEDTTTAATENTTTAATENTTTAATENTTTTAAAPTTTAANQSTKTGDVAPVTLFVVLVAAVAVVTVAAKKKEA